MNAGKPPPRPGLQNSTRHLVSIAALAAAGNRGGELVRYLRTALASGVREEEVREILLQMALLAGVPRAISGLEALTRAVDAEPPAPSVGTPRETLGPSEEARRAGRALFDRIYASNHEEILARLARLHPLLPDWIVTAAYGGILSRPTVPPLLREYASVAALAVLDQPDQLVAHMRGVLNLGGSREELREVLSHLSLHLDEAQAERLQRLLERM